MVAPTNMSQWLILRVGAEAGRETAGGKAGGATDDRTCGMGARPGRPPAAARQPARMKANATGVQARPVPCLVGGARPDRTLLKVVFRGLAAGRR